MSYAVFIGLDRGDRLIDWVELDDAGVLSGRGQLQNRPERLTEWVLALLARFPEQKIAIALEQPAAALLHFFRAFAEIDVFALNPGSVAAYRLSFKPSRAKSDALDAEIIARFLRDRHNDLRAFSADTPLTRRIAALVNHRRGLVDHRTKLTNELIALLKIYYPQALELTSEHIYASLAVAFLRKWPTFQSLRRARPETIRTFYREHGCVRRSALDKRLAIIAESVPLTDDETALYTGTLFMRTLLDQIETLQRSIERMETELIQAYGEHPDAFIFESLPRSGQIHCARLLAAFGTDRERFPTAHSILCYSGIAPILHSTGNRPNPLTLRRRACPVFVKQSFHEWAAQSIASSVWAKAFYEQQRAKGKKHHIAVRALAFKWIRIIHRMWTDRTRYNEQAYLDVLRKKGSSLVPDIDKILQEKKAQCA